MSRNQYNDPEMDYYELRRRHDEFKARSGAQRSVDAPVRQRPAQRAEAPSEDIEIRRPAQPEILPEEAPAEQPAPETDLSFEARIEESDMDYVDEDAARASASDNPFASFLQMANRVKGKMRTKRASRREIEDQPYEDIDFDDIPEQDGGYAPRPADAPQEQQATFEENAPEVPADIADIETGAPARAERGDYADDAGSGYGDEEYDEFADEPYEDEPYADEDPDRPRGFRKFLNLFITRVDPDEIEEEEYPEDGEYDDGEYYEDDELYEDDPYADEEVRAVGAQYDRTPSGIEGGLQNMDDMNNPTSAHIEQMAEGLENSGMTRRERRELAMRKAAEEAARREAEEAATAAAAAAAAAATAAAAVVPSVYDAPKQEVDMAAFKAASEEPVIESTAEDIPAEPVSAEAPAQAAQPENVEIADEPTREFKPVSRAAAEDAAAVAADDLFDVDQNFDAAGDDAEYEEERKPRRGLFGRRARRQQEEEDAYEDDPEAYDEEEEEEDRHSRRKSRKNRRSREEEIEDDEFEEEYEDEKRDRYDDDEFDEDKYDDEYEDEEDDEEDDEDEFDDEFDDDDSGRSFGHHLVGVLLVILGVVLGLLIAAIVLNFSCINGGNRFVDSLYNRFGDTGAFQFVFPAYKAQPQPAAMPAAVETEQVTEIAPIEEIAAPTATPEPEISIPTFGEAGSVNETAPQSAAAPANNAPANNQSAIQPVG